MKMLSRAALALLVLVARPAFAQFRLPQIPNAAGSLVPSIGTVDVDPLGNPLLGAAPAPALAGTAVSSGTIGPFLPQLNRLIWLTLSGTWSGTVQVCRSTDGGANCLPLTIAGQSWASFSTNANEAIGTESMVGATYYLQVTVSSGSISYRFGQ